VIQNDGLYITFERGGPKFSNTTARVLA